MGRRHPQPGDRSTPRTISPGLAGTARQSHASDSSGSPSSGWTTAKVFAFRQKAALFGATAPDPNLFVDAKNARLNEPSWSHRRHRKPLAMEELQHYLQQPDRSRLALSKVVVGSWFALIAQRRGAALQGHNSHRHVALRLRHQRPHHRTSRPITPILISATPTITRCRAPASWPKANSSPSLASPSTIHSMARSSTSTRCGPTWSAPRPSPSLARPRSWPSSPAALHFRAR